jgi:hypothetical protein
MTSALPRFYGTDVSAGIKLGQAFDDEGTNLILEVEAVLRFRKSPVQVDW